MEEYWAQSSEAGSTCQQFSEDSWTYNSSSPIQSSVDNFDSPGCMIQSNYDFQNRNAYMNYEDKFFAYNQANYASSSEKAEMFEDSCSEGEVQTLCTTGQEENSKSAVTKGGM